MPKSSYRRTHWIGSIAAGLLATVCGCRPGSLDSTESKVDETDDAILSPARSYTTVSAIFRQGISGVGTLPVFSVPCNAFLTTTVPNMRASGYELVDVDLTTSMGRTYCTGLFKSGVPATTYVEGTPSTFQSTIGTYDANGQRLIALRAFTALNGQQMYAGIVQSGSAAQYFPGAMDWNTFLSTTEAQEVNGYFLSNLAGYVSGGQERFLGVWRYHPQNTNRSALWVSEWNSFAKAVMTQASSGKRLASMAHWEFNGNRRYAGVWLDGTDVYDVVAATDVAVLNRKITELALQGKVPIQLNVERGYQPPLGLASAFNDMLDPFEVGYSYAISEQGTPTAMGGFGYARAPWESSNPGVTMSEFTRLGIASVTKAISVAALFKLLDNGTPIEQQLDRKVMDVLGDGVLQGKPAGSGVRNIRLRDLVDMSSGINEGKNEESCDGNAGDINFTNFDSWQACVLARCTADGAGTTCGTPPFPSHYNNADAELIRSVIEHLSQKDYQSYLHDAIFVPLGVDNSALPASDISNANCIPDYSTPTRPVYYSAGQTNGPGVEEQNAGDWGTGYSTDRSRKVCGAGGMQISARQMDKLLRGLMEGAFYSSTAFRDRMLQSWTFSKRDWESGPLFIGPGYFKNGGFGMSGDRGYTSAIALVPSTRTQVNVTGNSNVNDPVDPDNTIREGLNRMSAYPMGTFSVVSRDSATFGPMCFGAERAWTGNNTRILQSTCGTAPLALSEQFTQLDVGNGKFMLKSVSSGRCLATQFDDTAAGLNLVLYDCSGKPSQHFTFKPTSNGYGNLVVEMSGLCLTVSGGANSGNPIVQDTCSPGQTSQEFMLHPYDVVAVVNRDSAHFGAMCLNVSGNSTSQNAAIIQWTCGPEPTPSNMQFRRIEKGYGLFSLQAINSGRCVTVHNNSSASGEYMLQYDCNGLANQLFSFVPTSGGYGQLVAQNSGLCLTVSGGANSIYSGQAIIQQACTQGLSTQEFILAQQ